MYLFIISIKQKLKTIKYLLVKWLLQLIKLTNDQLFCGWILCFGLDIVKTALQLIIILDIEATSKMNVI